MKFFTIIIALIALALPAMAEDPGNSVLLKDFDRTMEGFSFSKGGLVQLNQDSDVFPMEIDFIFDMPSGLGMNNSELTEWFPGKAGIIDLDQISLDTETEIPTEGFNSFIGPEDIIPGHTYLIRTTDTEHFGKIHIVQFDAENEIIEFIWVSLDD